jgi:hypothetical protein
MKTSVSFSALLVVLALSGCVSNEAVYGKYTNFACNNTQLYFNQQPWPSAVYFNFDKDEITPTEARVLAKNIQILQQNPQMNVALVGHADPAGTENYNADLAQRRANVVADVLMQAGIARSRIKILNAGEMSTLVQSPSIQENRINRRTQLILLNSSMHPVTVGYGANTPSLNDSPNRLRDMMSKPMDLLSKPVEMLSKPVEMLSKPIEMLSKPFEGLSSPFDLFSGQ